MKEMMQNNLHLCYSECVGFVEKGKGQSQAKGKNETCLWFNLRRLLGWGQFSKIIALFMKMV